MKAGFNKIYILSRNYDLIIFMKTQYFNLIVW
jgi:hypothetical protein